MNKKKILLSTLVPVVGVSAIATAAVALTSCSNSGLYATYNSYDVNLQTVNNSIKTSTIDDTTTTPNRPTILPSIPTQPTIGEDEIDPNFNVNPITKIKELLNKVAISYVQSDLNDVVLEFLSCIEYDSKKSEIELLDREDVKNVIEVTKIKLDDNFLNTRKITVTANVNVEQEIGKKEQKRKIEGVTFDLYVEFAGKNDVLSLLTRLLNNKPDVGSNNEVDYEDLLELFLGENDRDLGDDDFDLDDYFDKDSSIEDIGLIKYMSNVNDKINANAKMFGYTFDVSQFWTNLAEKANANIKDARITDANNSNVFWAPSTNLCNIFMPNIKGNNIKLDLVISKITEEYPTFDEFRSEMGKLVNQSDKSQLLEKLKSFGLEFPDETIIIKSNLKNEFDYNNKIKSIELEFTTNKFKNKFEFEFYSNWWNKK